MVRRTFKDVKEDLRQIAGQAGLAPDDKRLREIVNLVQENLLEKAKSVVGTVHRIRFRQHDGIVALSPRYDRLVDVSVNNKPTETMSLWYEFLDYGPGLLSHAGNVSALVDRGESPIHRLVISEPGFIRVIPREDERVSGVRPKIRFLGYDEHGQWVRTLVGDSWVDGVELELDGDSATGYTQSTVRFSKITQVIKPKTNAALDVYIYNIESDEPLKFAARYEHWETNPSRRLYAISEPTESLTIDALALVRFRPIEDDNDELLITSLPALRLGVRAVAKENADDLAAANDSWTLAVNALNDQARRYYGSPKPAVRVSKIAGAYGGISNIL